MSEYNATYYMEQGGHTRRDENVAKSTAASTGLDNYGWTVVTTTLNQQLDAPKLGAIKDIIVNVTTGKKARIKTGSTAIFFNSSNGKDFIIEVTQAKANVSNHGYHLRLVGESTKQWWTASNHTTGVSWVVAFKQTS